MFSPSLRVILRLALCLTSMLAWAQSDDPTQGRPTVGVVYMHTNHLGSTTFTTDENGQLKARFVYEPYGSIYRDACLGSDDVRPKFTGKELDADTELYYFEARYYDAQSGRFVSADNQAGAAVNHPMAFHRYAYSGNNPINITDPSGRSLKDEYLPKEDAQGYAKSKQIAASVRRITEAWTPTSVTLDESIATVSHVQINTDPPVMEDDITVSGECVIDGETVPIEVALMQILQDAWAVYIAEYGVEVSVGTDLPILFPDGTIASGVHINSDPDALGIVTVGTLDFGAGFIIGGTVSATLKHNTRTNEYFIELAADAGVGARINTPVIDAEITAVGLERKVIVPIDGMSLQWDERKVESAIYHTVELGIFEIKFENDVTDYFQRIEERKAAGLPDAWAVSHYSVEDYVKTMEWALRFQNPIIIDGVAIWGQEAQWIIHNVKTMPDTYYQNYQEATNDPQQGLNFPLQEELPGASNTFGQGG